jgi:hypothetical protein
MATIAFDKPPCRPPYLKMRIAGINDGVKLVGSPGYPTLVEDFKNTPDMQAAYTPDIWVSSHAAQFNMHNVDKPCRSVQSRRYQIAYERQLAIYVLRRTSH